MSNRKITIELDEHHMIIEGPVSDGLIHHLVDAIDEYEDEHIDSCDEVVGQSDSLNTTIGQVRAAREKVYDLMIDMIYDRGEKIKKLQAELDEARHKYERVKKVVFDVNNSYPGGMSVVQQGDI